MSHRRRDFDLPGRDEAFEQGLGEDAGENILTVTTTPSGAPTRQSAAITDGSVDWAGIANAAVPALLSVYQQQQMTRLNVARINAGQPPLSVSEYSQFYRAPSAEVQIGATESAQRMMMIFGLGILGLVGLRAAKII